MTYRLVVSQRAERDADAIYTVAHEAVHVAAVRGFGQDLATAEEIELP